jgi:outer membrane immunogenic protein
MDYDEDYLEKVFNQTYPGLTMYVRDVNLPDAIAQKYTKGLVVSPICAPSFAETHGIGFDGLYIGAAVNKSESDGTHVYSNGAPSGDSSPDGTFAGLFVGFERNVNNFRLGVEFNYAQPNIDGRFNDTNGITSEGIAQLDEEYSLSILVGYPIKQHEITPYFKAGASIAEVNIEGGPANGAAGNGYSATYEGWHAALGLEKSINDNLSALIEYKYTDYGEESGTLAPQFPGVSMPVELEIQTFTLGVKYVF